MSKTRPKPPQPTQTPASGQPTSPALANRWAAAVMAVLAAILGYWVLFFVAEPLRIQQLAMLLLPEELISSWHGHNPALIEFGDRIMLLGVASLILLLAYLAGDVLMRWIGADTGLGRTEHLVFATGTGLNVLSLLMLTIGLLGGLQQRRWILLATAVILAAKGLSWWKERSSSASSSTGGGDWPERPGILSRRWLWLAAPFAIVIILGSMLPPWDFDVREYHLQVPKEFFLKGRIDFMPHNIFGNMPLGAEMHALLSMVITQQWWWGALVGKTVIGSLALWTAAALWAAGRRFFGPATGIVAALVYISTPWVAHVSMSGLIDVAMGFYLFLSVYAMLLWSTSREGKRSVALLLLSGFLAGAAVACKYPAVLFVVIPLTIWAGCGRWLSLRWRPAAIFLIAVFIGCGPWLAKNWVLTGNPTYPLLYEVFGGRTRSPEKDAQWKRAVQVPRDAEGRRYSLPQLVDSAARLGWRSEFHSPLLVPLAALALLRVRNERVTLAILLLFGFILASWWLVTHRIDRFLVPAIPLMALLAGVGAGWSSDALWRRSLIIVLLLGLLANFALITGPVVADNRYLVSLDYLRHDPADPETGISRLHPAHRVLNQVVPPGHRVLLVGDARPFDLAVPAIYSTCFDDCIFEQLMKGRTAEERREVLKRLKISHIFFDWSEIRRYRRTYGFSDYVTPQLVHEQLVQQQQLLRRLEIPLESEQGEIFEVRGQK